MRSCVITIRKYPGPCNLIRQKVSQPQCSVSSSPSLHPVTIQSVDRYNAAQMSILMDDTGKNELTQAEDYGPLPAPGGPTAHRLESPLLARAVSFDVLGAIESKAAFYNREFFGCEQ